MATSVAVAGAVADRAAEPVDRRGVGRHPRHDHDCPCRRDHPDAYREAGGGRTVLPVDHHVADRRHHRHHRRPPQRGVARRPLRAPARPPPAPPPARPPTIGPDSGRDRGATRPAPTPARAAMHDGDDAAWRHGDEECGGGHDGAPPSQASPGRGTCRATRIASVAAMPIAATDVISAAVQPSVPQPAAGIATATIAAPAMRRTGIPAGSHGDQERRVHRGGRCRPKLAPAPFQLSRYGRPALIAVAVAWIVGARLHPVALAVRLPRLALQLRPRLVRGRAAAIGRRPAVPHAGARSR